MDSELLELQKLFAATQEAKSTVRLSERNVVELVSKLQELQLLDSDLLHTVTGKEYMTKERLKTEAEFEVKRLGRVSLVDLATTIGVELIHCERVAEQIVANNCELTLVQGEVIADSYWDSVAEEINEALQESGQISVGELAKRYNVGAELLTRVLESRIGNNSIQGKLEAGQLYTPAFVARIKAMVRGAVRALTVPTPLSDVWSSLQKELREGDDGSVGVPGGGGLFQSVLNGLIAAGDVKGTLRGGGASWIPAVFAQSQRESVEAFFSQNGYISYDVLRKLVIANPKAYLQDKYPEGIALETVFVHTSLISVLDAAAEEAINGGAWLDTMLLVPPCFSIPDVAMLVNLFPSVQKAKKESTGVILAETCVVSLDFVKILFERLEVEIRTLAEKAATEQGLKSKKADTDGNSGASSSNSILGTEKDEDGEEEIVQGKNARKKRGNQHSVKERVKEDAEEESYGKGAKGKKRSARNKGGISLLVGESGTGASKSSKGSPKEDADMPSQEVLAEKILEWYPDMETAGIEGDDSGESGVLAKSLADWVRPSVISTWTAVKQASFSAGSEDRRRRVDDLQRQIDEVYANFQLFEKALYLFEEDNGTSVILQRHLLRTTAAEIVDLFLTAQNLERKLEEGESSETQESSSSRDPLSNGERLSLAKNMPGAKLSSRAVELVEAVEGKSVQAFESALEAAMKESGLRLKKLDKKSERALLHSHRKVLASEIDDETDPVALLPKVVALLFIQVYNRALQAPGRAMAAAVTRLKDGISDNYHGTLLDYHKITVQFLSMQATISLDDETDCTNDRLREKREALVARMPVLKSIAVPADGSLKMNKS